MKNKILLMVGFLAIFSALSMTASASACGSCHGNHELYIPSYIVDSGGMFGMDCANDFGCTACSCTPEEVPTEEVTEETPTEETPTEEVPEETDTTPEEITNETVNAVTEDTETCAA